MATLTRDPSIPTNFSAVVYDSLGREIRVTGAGPWTVTAAEKQALLDACRVVVGAQIKKIGT